MITVMTYIIAQHYINTQGNREGPALALSALVLRPLHQTRTACACKLSSRIYKLPSFSYLVSLLSWGWLEHLVEMLASFTPSIKLSSKNLHCFSACGELHSQHWILITSVFCWSTSLGWLFLIESSSGKSIFSWIPSWYGLVTSVRTARTSAKFEEP